MPLADELRTTVGLVPAHPLSAKSRLAAWLLTPVAWLLLVGGCLGLVLAGPFALLLVPVALPPLALIFLQARSGTRLLRGQIAAALPLFATAVVASVALVVGAAIALPGPTTEPPPPADIPTDVRAGLTALLGAAFVQALAAALLWPTARSRLRPSLPRLVGLALCLLVLAQAVVLTVATRSR